MLEGKKILLVDDEPDVLDTLDELLPMCKVVKASNFKAAKDYLETRYFDMAILDIMGVDGFALLEIATHRNVPAVMLTAHALSPENIVKSYQEGAVNIWIGGQSCEHLLRQLSIPFHLAASVLVYEACRPIHKSGNNSAGFGCASYCRQNENVIPYAHRPIRPLIPVKFH